VAAVVDAGLVAAVEQAVIVLLCQENHLAVEQVRKLDY